MHDYFDIFLFAGVLRHHQKRREDIPFGYTWQWTHGSSESPSSIQTGFCLFNRDKSATISGLRQSGLVPMEEQLSLDERLLL